VRGAVASLLLRNRQALGVALPPEGVRLRWLVVNASTAPSARLVCLCWVGTAPEPAAAAKFARHPRFNARVEREYRALERLSAYAGSGPARVPRPVGTALVGRRLVAVETGLHGRPLRTLLHERRGECGAILQRWEPLLEWVIELGARSRRPATNSDYEEMVFAPLDRAGGELGLDEVEQSALLRLRERAGRLASEQSLPIVFAHRDLGTPNVLAGSRGEFAGVVDWEDGGPGLPASDLFFFLGRFAYETRGAGTADELRGFREIYFGEGAGTRSGALAPATARRWLERYCEGVGLDRRWLPVIFALTWIAAAQDERRQLAERAQHNPVREAQSQIGRPAIQPDHFLQHLRTFLRRTGGFATAVGLESSEDEETL
jgi:aminoglycoside phosphotransferase (APT) family kinase protein